MKLNLWWILMGEKEFLTTTLGKNIHWWCPRQILSPALSQSCIWKERWSAEVLGWVFGVSCTDCHCPSLKPRATTLSWASLVPSLEHVEQCWECLRYCCTCVSIPHPTWSPCGLPEPQLPPSPTSHNRNDPNLGVSQLQGQESPQSHGIPAPTPGIPPISGYPLKQKAKVI